MQSILIVDVDICFIHSNTNEIKEILHLGIVIMNKITFFVPRFELLHRELQKMRLS
jgi:hypothetical protein